MYGAIIRRVPLYSRSAVQVGLVASFVRVARIIRSAVSLAGNDVWPPLSKDARQSLFIRAGFDARGISDKQTITRNCTPYARRAAASVANTPRRANPADSGNSKIVETKTRRRMGASRKRPGRNSDRGRREWRDRKSRRNNIREPSHTVPCIPGTLCTRRTGAVQKPNRPTNVYFFFCSAFRFRTYMSEVARPNKL